MGVFEQFPYTNFHGVNLSWILEKVRDHETRITSLEGRMTQAEDDIDALEGRMDTAEDDIDALEGRMDTAEGDIDALEGRMDTAEGDIDALEMQMPKSAAGSAGKVLTSTGAGTATWQDVPKELPATLGTAGQVLTVNSDADGVEWKTTPIYIDYDADNIPDPADYLSAAVAGIPIYLRSAGSSWTFVRPMVQFKQGPNHKYLLFEDMNGVMADHLGLASNPAAGLWWIFLMNDNDNLQWWAGQNL